MTREELEAEVERLRENADARERDMRREVHLLRAAQREVDELRATYAALRQTSAVLCVVCGWRFFVPDVGSQACERARLEADVERLRAHRELCTVNLRKGYETGKADERAAVVAWLREQAESTNFRPRGCPLADAIERGEHCREEGR